jgi:hypothetical protein
LYPLVHLEQFAIAFTDNAAQWANDGGTIWQIVPPMQLQCAPGLAHAATIADNRAQRRKSYEDFLALWKGADVELPILGTASNQRTLVVRRESKHKQVLADFISSPNPPANKVIDQREYQR